MTLREAFETAWKYTLEEGGMFIVTDERGRKFVDYELAGMQELPAKWYPKSRRVVVSLASYPPPKKGRVKNPSCRHPSGHRGGQKTRQWTPPVDTIWMPDDGELLV